MKYYKKAKEIMDMDATEFIGGVSEYEKIGRAHV